MHRKIDVGCDARFRGASKTDVKTVVEQQCVTPQPSFSALLKREQAIEDRVCAGIVAVAPDGRVFIHNPKTQEKGAFQGFSDKVNEFSLGGYDGFSIDDSDDTIHLGLQTTEIHEAYEECGILCHNLKYLCDLNIAGQWVRYYVGDYLSGDPRMLERAGINETKSVVLTPVHKLKRLFESNVAGLGGVGSSDLIVLEYLYAHLTPKAVAQMSMDYRPLNPGFPPIELLGSDDLNRLYSAYSEFKFSQLSHAFDALDPEYSKKEIDWDGRRIAHFDAHYGRINAAWDIPQFVLYLKTQYPNSHAEVIKKVHGWLAESLGKRFENQGLVSHFFFQHREFNGIDKFDHGVFDLPHRIPIVCTSMLFKDIPFRDLGARRDPLTGRRCVFMLPKAEPLVMSKTDMYSSNLVGIFDHPDFKAAMNHASTPAEFLEIAKRFLVDGAGSDGLLNKLSNPEKLKRDYLSFKDALEAGPSREWSWSGYRNALRRGFVDWNECLQLVSSGQLAGIGINANSNLDINWAFRQSEYHRQQTGFPLPIFHFNYDSQSKSYDGLRLMTADELLDKWQSQDNIKLMYDLLGRKESLSEGDMALLDLTTQLTVLSDYKGVGFENWDAKKDFMDLSSSRYWFNRTLTSLEVDSTASVTDKLTYIQLFEVGDALDRKIEDEISHWVGSLALIAGDPLDPNQVNSLEKYLEHQAMQLTRLELDTVITTFRGGPAVKGPTYSIILEMIEAKLEAKTIAELPTDSGVLNFDGLELLLSSPNIATRKTVWAHLASVMERHSIFGERIVTCCPIINALPGALDLSDPSIFTPAAFLGVRVLNVMLWNSRLLERGEFVSKMATLLPLCAPSLELSKGCRLLTAVMNNQWDSEKNRIVRDSRLIQFLRYSDFRPVILATRGLFPDRYRAGIIREAKDRFVHLEDALKQNEIKNLFIYCGHLYSKGKLEKAAPVLSLLQQLIPSEK